MSTIKKSPLAEKDADKIWDYLAPKSLSGAIKVVHHIDKALSLLAKNPLAGSLREEFQPNLRSFVVDKYLLFYRPIQNGIELVRILHGARDIEALL